MKKQVFLWLVWLVGALPGEALTLAELQNLAVSHSYDRQELLAQTQADQAGARASAAMRLPRLSGSADAGWDDTVGGWQTSVNAIVTWDLAALVDSKPSDAAFRARQDLWQTQSVTDQLRLNVALSWARLLVLSQEVHEDARLAKIFETHLDHLQRMKAEGVDLTWDILRVKNQLSALNTTSLSTASALQDQLALLSRLIGRTLTLGDVDFSSSKSVPRFEEQFWRQNLGAFVTSRPEVQAALVGVQAAQAQGERAQLAWLPQIKAYGGYQPTSLGPNRKWGVSADFSLVDWGSQQALSQSYRSLGQSQSARAAALREKLTQELETLIRGTTVAHQVWLQSQGEFKNADEALKEAQELYREGRIKETDLLGAALDWESAKTRVSDAQMTFLQDAFTLTSLYGGH
ncbi:MAG: TolC family protein [Spirochaetales bacterium]|nr:TolC family protein [Spirochaetales bacterium]